MKPKTQTGTSTYQEEKKENEIHFPKLQINVYCTLHLQSHFTSYQALG